MLGARTAVVAVALVALLAGCTDTARTRTDTGGPTVTLPTPGVPGGLMVAGKLDIFVATEMALVAEALRFRFIRDNPGAEVSLTVGNGRALIVQAVGRPLPDVYLASSADVARLTAYLPDTRDTGTFGRDQYVIATPIGNPGLVTDLLSFAQADNTTVCSHLLPSAGERVPEALPFDPATEPKCATDTVAGLAAGIVTAAVLPRSTVNRHANVVELLDIPPEDNISVMHRFAVLSDDVVAVGFVNFLQSEAGRRIRVRSGYRS